jgi:hypothetical protein
MDFHTDWSISEGPATIRKIILHSFRNHNFGFEFCDNLFICKSSFYGNYELKKKLQTIDIYIIIE